jgi:molecular chaperone GrpE
MPEPTPPPDAGGAAGRRDGPLTPDAIETALADFRRWLEDLAAGAPEPPPESGEPAVDLAALVGAFTALRHEVNLQTKAARAQTEQFAQALESFRQPPPTPSNDDALRPLVKAMTEVYDTLTRAAKELDQLRQGVGDLGLARDNEVETPERHAHGTPPRRLSFLARLFGGRAAQGGNPSWRTELHAERKKCRSELQGVADRLAAAATGLRLSERRVERLMREVGLEPVECAGRPFDPEAMEAVEAAAGSGQPPGTVVEELRRGYRWRGRVFRYAQVRVAR